MSKPKKNSNYGVDQRQNMETNEQVEVINTGLPGTRFDDQVQVQTGKDAVTNPNEQGGSGSKDLAPSSAKVLKNKIKIHPTSDVQISEDKQVGGVPITSGVVNAKSAAGASIPSPVLDESRKPYTEGQYRPETRAGKVTGQDDFIINNTINEQIIPGFEGSKDLREAPKALQGYNGQKQFKTARGKKNAGTVPQSILFERSIDYIKHDATIHTTGQVLDNIDEKSNYPTKYYVDATDEREGHYENIDSPMTKGNYLLKSFNFHIDADGKISSISFNEDYLPAHVEPGNADQANMNWQVDGNNVTKAILELQVKLGRETTSDWSMLGYVMKQTYEYNMLAHDIEAVTGAMMALAYRSGVTSLAHRSNNLLAKDGAKSVTPIAEMFLEGIGQLPKSLVEGDFTNMNQDMFAPETLRKGSAAAIIKMFDSTTKFSTKASFFNLPRSLKYFLQNADNNIDPLRCKKQFIMALDTVHTYSTPSGEYSPVLPIYATDKISIVNPMSLNYFLRGWNRNNVSSDNPAGTSNLYSYQYNDLRNDYTWYLKHPIVDGICEWLIEHEANLVKAYGVNCDVNMPAFFSMLAPSMFQHILCAASFKILFRRNVIFRDWLFANDQLKSYMFKDLSSLHDLNPLYSTNMKITSYRDPIVVGKLKPASAIQTFWGESYSVAGTEDPAAGTKKVVIMLPWFYNEAGLKNEYDADYGFYKDDYGTKCKMSFPELRLGVNHDYIDYLFSMDERDVRLCLDRPIGIPIFMTKTDPTTKLPYTKYSISSDKTESAISAHMKLRALRYDKNSDGRVVVEYDNAATERYVPNKAGIMCLPRELGFIYPSLRVSPILSNVREVSTGSGDNLKHYVDWKNVGSYNVNAVIDGSQGYSAISYSAEGSNLDSTSISRTAALKQYFITCFADRSDSVIPYNNDYSDQTGMLLSLSACFTPGTDVAHTSISARATLSPFYTLNGINHSSDLTNTVNVISLSKYMWTLLNRFFMPNNPFENNHISVGAKEDFTAAGVLIDPLEPSFFFGIAGFLASDFGQDVLDRADRIDQLNIDYTEDEFIKSSLIFRAD